MPILENQPIPTATQSLSPNLLHSQTNMSNSKESVVLPSSPSLGSVSSTTSSTGYGNSASFLQTGQELNNASSSSSLNSHSNNVSSINGAIAGSNSSDSSSGRSSSHSNAGNNNQNNQNGNSASPQAQIPLINETEAEKVREYRHALTMRHTMRQAKQRKAITTDAVADLRKRISQYNSTREDASFHIKVEESQSSILFFGVVKITSFFPGMDCRTTVIRINNRVVSSDVITALITKYHLDCRASEYELWVHSRGHECSLLDDEFPLEIKLLLDTDSAFPDSNVEFCLKKNPDKDKAAQILGQTIENPLFDNVLSSKNVADTGIKLKTGYLNKRSMAPGTTRNWKVCYFVLTNEALCYYKSSNDTKPQAVLHISQITDIEFVDESLVRRKNCFRLACPSYIFCCAVDEKSSRDWVERLRQVKQLWDLQPDRQKMLLNSKRHWRYVGQNQSAAMAAANAHAGLALSNAGHAVISPRNHRSKVAGGGNKEISKNGTFGRNGFPAIGFMSPALSRSNSAQNVEALDSSRSGTFDRKHKKSGSSVTSTDVESAAETGVVGFAKGLVRRASKRFSRRGRENPSASANANSSSSPSPSASTFSAPSSPAPSVHTTDTLSSNDASQPGSPQRYSETSPSPFSRNLGTSRNLVPPSSKAGGAATTAAAAAAVAAANSTPTFSADEESAVMFGDDFAPMDSKAYGSVMVHSGDYGEFDASAVEFGDEDEYYERFIASQADDSSHWNGISLLELECFIDSLHESEQIAVTAVRVRYAEYKILLLYAIECMTEDSRELLSIRDQIAQLEVTRNALITTTSKSLSSKSSSTSSILALVSSANSGSSPSPKEPRIAYASSSSSINSLASSTSSSDTRSTESHTQNQSSSKHHRNPSQSISVSSVSSSTSGNSITIKVTKRNSWDNVDESLKFDLSSTSKGLTGVAAAAGGGTGSPAPANATATASLAVTSHSPTPTKKSNTLGSVSSSDVDEFNLNRSSSLSRSELRKSKRDMERQKKLREKHERDLLKEKKEIEKKEKEREKRERDLLLEQEKERDKQIKKKKQPEEPPVPSTGQSSPGADANSQNGDISSSSNSASPAKSEGRDSWSLGRFSPFARLSAIRRSSRKSLANSSSQSSLADNSNSPAHRLAASNNANSIASSSSSN